MSGTRDRLGLLLPLPALLALEPTSAQAHDDGSAREHHAGSDSQARAGGLASATESEPESEPVIGPCLSTPPEDLEPNDPDDPNDSNDLMAPPSGERPLPPASIEQPPGWLEAPPTPEEVEVRARFEQGRQAFDAGDHRAAAAAFEQAVALAPELPALSLDATIAYAYAALQEQDPERASELCEATRRHAEATIGHPEASETMAQYAQTLSIQADEHCTRLAETMYGPCLSVMPCLEPPYRSRGCAGRGEPVAMLGSLMLLGFARRRRDAVERVAQRLPPDVAARLRRGSDEPDTDEPDTDG
ncbi:MAG: hypothetical protein KDK70_01810 [Myxococcales bacterium]|nr:hypothetical protein [Myxococcales bacterium]